MTQESENSFSDELHGRKRRIYILLSTALLLTIWLVVGKEYMFLKNKKQQLSLIMNISRQQLQSQELGSGTGARGRYFYISKRIIG